VPYTPECPAHFECSDYEIIRELKTFKYRKGPVGSKTYHLELSFDVQYVASWAKYN